MLTSAVLLSFDACHFGASYPDLIITLDSDDSLTGLEIRLYRVEEHFRIKEHNGLGVITGLCKLNELEIFP